MTLGDIKREVNASLFFYCIYLVLIAYFDIILMQLI